MMKLFLLVALLVLAAAQVHAACTIDPNSNPNPPALVITDANGKETYLDNNQLQVFVGSSLQYKAVTFQFLQPGTSTYGVPACDFNWLRPADLGASNSASNTNNNWSPSVLAGACNVNFVGIWPAVNVASTLGSCFAFDNVTDSTHNIYTADVRVTTQQDRPAIRGLPIVKVTSTNIRFSFKFQRVVTVSTNQVSVTGSVTVISTVVEQVFNPFVVTDDQSNVIYPAGSTTVRLLTSVQYPYKLTYGLNAPGGSSSTVTQPPNPSYFSGCGCPQTIDTYRVTSIQPSAAFAAGIFTNCTDTPGSICYQVWEVTVTELVQTCTPSTNIGFYFTVICEPGFQGTCVTAANAGYSTSYSLAVSNSCNQVVEDIGLTGSLTSFASFADASSNKPTSDFIFDQTAFFLATLTPSAGSPNIISSSVTQVTVSSIGDPVVFTAPVTGANPSQFATLAVNGRPGFSFLVDSNAVALTSIDSAQTVTVAATISVTFANLQTATKTLIFPGSKFLLQGSSSLSLATDMVVSSSASNPGSTASSSSSLLAIVAGVVGGCVLVAIVAGVIIYRRTTQSFVKELQGQSVKVMQVYMPASSSSNLNMTTLTSSAPAEASV